MSEHANEIAKHALLLLGALVESHADNGIATPPMYQALDVAIQMAEHLDDNEELLELLKFTQIQCGEVVAVLTERIENLSNLIEKAKESDTLGEFVKNLTEHDE
jgi:hypothetical protein